MKSFKTLKLSLFLLAFFTNLFCTAQTWFEMVKQDHVNYYEVVKENDAYYATHDRGPGSGYKLYQRWKYFSKRIMDDNGNIYSQSEILEAKQRFDKKRKNRRVLAEADNWKELGPFAWRHSGSWNPGVGRITAIAIEKQHQQLLFAGSPGGGIWRSRDAAQNWSPIGDNMTNMHIYGIGIDPFNTSIVYAINGAGRIIKSTNQGDTWIETFNTGSNISRNMSIIFHPNNRGTLLIASASGVWKSTNSGSSFTKVLNVYIEDLAYKPNDPNIVYACGDRFYKSWSGGDAFIERNTGIVSTERMRMAVTPANSNYIYLVQRSGGNFGHFYRSTNAGESFGERSANNTPYFTQAHRDMAIMVSTTNADEVHVAGMNNHRSRDGGNNFEELSAWSSPDDPSYIHADVEVMMCINDVFYTGSDGGVYKSTNHGDNYTDLSTLGGLAVHQFYRIAGTPQDPNMIIGGSQDNGVNIMKNKDRTWNAWLGADGMEAFIDPSNSNIVYGMTQNGGMNKSTNGGNNRVTINKPVSGDGNWVTPFFIDPSTPSNIYAGYDGLFRSTDRGINWSKISNSVNTGGNIDEATIAPSNNNYIYMARGNSFWRTTNGQSGNPTWNLVNSFSGKVNFIAVDPNDPARVAIACSGSRVYVSTNAGSNWTDKKMNLPNTGAECVIFDDQANNGLYIGTDNAVYFTSDDISSWVPFSNGLPTTAIRDFDISFSTNTIRVATHGRGLFESPLYGLSGPKPSTGVITVFEDCNGQGFSGGLGIGNYNLEALKTLGIQNDWISSIHIAEGFKVVIYWDDNFKGTSTELTNNTECLSGINWDNQISSIQVQPNGDPNLEGLYYLQNKHSGLVLDIHGYSKLNGGNAIQYSFGGNLNQQFKLKHQGDGSYRIISENSGKSLDVDITNGNIQQWEWFNTTNQKFIAIPAGNGYYKFINESNGRVIEVANWGTSNLNNIMLWASNNQANAHWKLNGVSTNIVTVFDQCDHTGFSVGLKTGNYTSTNLASLFIGNDRISSIKIAEGFKVTLYKNNNFGGDSIELTSTLNCFSEEWNNRISSIKISSTGTVNLDNTYFIQNRSSGLYMEVNGGTGAIDNGAKIIQYAFNGNTNQQFELTDRGDGSYSVIAKHSGKGLDVARSSMTSGDPVQQWEYIESSNQKFVMYPTGNGYYKLIAEHSGMVVEVSTHVNGEQVHQWYNHGGNNAQWKFVPSNTVTGTGTGLRANYFNGKDFENPILSRIDKTVDFNWKTGSPDPLINENSYSVRWTGKVQATVDGEYTFYIDADDGRKLWIDDKLLIDNWLDGGNEKSGTITLSAGQKYDIRMDYFENAGDSRMRLLWSTNILSKEIVPITQLYPNELPTISITTPESNNIVQLGETVPITLTANDSTSLSRVELYNNNELITTFYTAPFTYDLNGLEIGNYSLTALAYDSLEAVTLSKVVTYEVSDITNINKMTFNGKLILYPNPAEDVIFIGIGNNFKTIQVMVYDITGHLVLSQTMNSHELDISNLTSGAYTIKIEVDDAVITEKLIKN